MQFIFLAAFVAAQDCSSCGCGGCGGGCGTGDWPSIDISNYDFNDDCQCDVHTCSNCCSSTQCTVTFTNAGTDLQVGAVAAGNAYAIMRAPKYNLNTGISCSCPRYIHVDSFETPVTTTAFEPTTGIAITSTTTVTVVNISGGTCDELNTAITNASRRLSTTTSDDESRSLQEDLSFRRLNTVSLVNDGVSKADANGGTVTGVSVSTTTGNQASGATTATTAATTSFYSSS